MAEANIQLLRLPEVERTTGIKRATIYKLAALGQFPSPIKLTSKTSAWLSSEIEEWVQSRISASRPERG